MSVSTPTVLARALLRLSRPTPRPRGRRLITTTTTVPPPRPLRAGDGRRAFHAARRLAVVKPFLLADIGEGITECQLIQWFVQPGARVEQFDKLCEVQSDKASVEITSPFDGVIKKLHYEPDDMAITGKPLVDIDIQSEISEADEAKLAGGAEGAEGEGSGGKTAAAAAEKEEEGRAEVEAEGVGAEHAPDPPAQTASEQPQQSQQQQQQQPSRPGKGDKGSLATPAVRHLIKEHKLDITDVQGTGKDGRVLKEDVHRHVSGGEQRSSAGAAASATPAHTPSTTREDRAVPLTPVQSQMFKAMTRAVQIPHFLYSCTADMTALTALRQKLNAAAAPEEKLTHLAFIVKAVSLAFQQHPLLNAALDARDAKKPQLTYRGAHHFGIAIDSPAGLVVPVLKDVQARSVREIAAAMRALSAKARDNKLAPQDFGGATFTLSNIGSVGGGVVAPVISEPQVAILGIGRSRRVPAFDADGGLVAREELVMNWSADHRVVDGAECARCAERVNGFLNDPGAMMVAMR